MSIYKTNTVLLCQDCTIAVVNGDFTGLDYHYTEETAAALMERIQEGERLLIQRAGVLHHAGSDPFISSHGCNCCGRFERSITELSEFHCYAPAVYVDSYNGLSYTDSRFILSAVIEPMAHHKRGLSWTASGYGRKIPTEYMLNCADNRRRRVYCCIFSNSGTLYIRYKGRDLILDIDTRHRLEDIMTAA